MTIKNLKLKYEYLACSSDPILISSWQLCDNNNTIPLKIWQWYTKESWNIIPLVQNFFYRAQNFEID